MPALLRTADDVLRRAAWTARTGQAGVGLTALFCCVAAFAAFYGAVMGAYRGLNGQPEWLIQIVYSAIKTPLLLIVSFLVSLPSFLVVGTLLGLRDDLGRAVRAVIAAQAALAIALASLAPLTLLFYASSADYKQSLTFNGIVFAAASIAGQFVLRQHFRPLVARNPRHRRLLIVWGVAYVFVAIQMAWLLRPFLGSSGLRVTFFRPEAWDNAYVQVVRLVWRTLFGG